MLSYKICFTKKGFFVADLKLNGFDKTEKFDD